MNSTSKGPLLGWAAVALWSLSAWLGSELRHLPPLLTTGLALTIGGLAGGAGWRKWRVPWRVFLTGLAGIFGHHFLYFHAFTRAPAVEVQLINSLWPHLLVLLTPLFLAGHALRARHLVGLSLGLGGTILVVGGGRLAPEAAPGLGHLAAMGAATTWAVYSLVIKRGRPFPSEAVSGFCLAAGVLALGVHSLNDGAAAAVSKISARDALSISMLGIGPLGMAFLVWDRAVKRSDPRTLGAIAYAVPLASTLVLIVMGGETPDRATAAALALLAAATLVGRSGIERSGINRFRTSLPVAARLAPLAGVSADSGSGSRAACRVPR